MSRNMGESQKHMWWVKEIRQKVILIPYMQISKLDKPILLFFYLYWVIIDQNLYVKGTMLWSNMCKIYVMIIISKLISI